MEGECVPYTYTYTYTYAYPYYLHFQFQIELKTNPETGFPERRTIKFGTNCDLSDERKWKPQIQVGGGDDDDGDGDRHKDDNDAAVAGDDEAPLLVARCLRREHALTHRPPDPWHEHHPALHEGDHFYL